MEASRKDEFGKCNIYFWLALKMTLEGKDEKMLFFFILRERKLEG